MNRFIAFFVAFFAIFKVWSADIYISSARFSSAQKLIEDEFESFGFMPEDSAEQLYIDFYDSVVPRVIVKTSAQSISVEENDISLDEKIPQIFLEYDENEETQVATVSISCTFEDVTKKYDFSMSSLNRPRVFDFATYFISSFIRQFSHSSAQNNSSSLHIIDFFALSPNKTPVSSLAVLNDASFVVCDFAVRAFDFLGSPILNFENSGEKIVQNAPDGFLLFDKNEPILQKFDFDGKLLEKTKLQNYFFDANFCAFVPTQKRVFTIDNDSQICAFVCEKDFEPLPLFIQNAHDFCAFGDGLSFLAQSAIFFVDKYLNLENVIFLDHTKNSSLLTVFDDGAALIMEENETQIVLKKIAKNGAVLWTFDAPQEIKSLKAISHSNGIFVGYSSDDCTIFRFFENEAEIPPILREISSKTQEIFSSDSIAEKLVLYKERAELYFTEHGYYLASQDFSRYLEFCLADSEIAEKNAICEFEILKSQAKNLFEKTILTLQNDGEEKARSSYRAFLAILEKAQKFFPTDDEIFSMAAQLETAFDPNFAPAPAPNVRVLDVSLDAIFPFFQNAENPVGFVSVKNCAPFALKNVRLSAFIPDFSDFSTESEAISIDSSEEAELEVNVFLNEKSRSLFERKNVPMTICVKWEEDDGEKNIEFIRNVTLLEKNAITWDDTSLLSDFVQPNDESVRMLSSSVLKNEFPIVFSANISKAIRLFDFLSSIPLDVLQNKKASATELAKIPFSVDTVQNCAQTLKNNGGDQSDLAVLVCSVFENAGVPTAIISMRGHIFVAFDAGERRDFLWDFLPSDFCALQNGENAWIPLEISSICDGFLNAWQCASEEIKSNKIENNPVEFIAISENRSSYKMSDSPKKIEKINVDAKKMKTIFDADILRVGDVFENALFSALNENQSAKNLNRIAQVFFLLGRTEKAISVLENAPDDDAILSNLENLKSFRRDFVWAE